MDLVLLSLALHADIPVMKKFCVKYYRGCNNLLKMSSFMGKNTSGNATVTSALQIELF